MADVDDRVRNAEGRIKAATQRVDQFFDRLEEQERRAREDDRRNDAQIAAETNRQAQIKYDEIFARYDERCPMPQAEQSPASYARQLMRTVQRKLSPADDRTLSNGATVGEIARAPIDEMNRSVREMMEPMFFEAGAKQAERPHVSTLPPTGFVERVRVDQNSGVKKREFYGRQSFIRDFALPPKLVVGFRPQGINGPLLNTTGVPVVLRER